MELPGGKDGRPGVRGRRASGRKKRSSMEKRRREWKDLSNNLAKHFVMKFRLKWWTSDFLPWKRKQVYHEPGLPTVMLGGRW